MATLKGALQKTGNGIKKLFKPKVLAILAILAIGGAAGFLLSDQLNNDKSNPATGPKAAAALNADLVLLGVQQFNLLNETSKATIDNTKDKEALKTSLDEATGQLASAVGAPYGPEQEEAAKKAYKVYEDQILAYAVAVKSNNSTAKQDAINKLTSDYVDALTLTLSKANPKIQNTYIQAGFGSSATNAMRVIDQHVAGNTAQELNEAQAGSVAVKSFYSYLAEKTAEQFPDRYSKQ